MTLSDAHLYKLRQSALSDEQAAALGWSSLQNGRLLIPYLKPDGSPETCHDGKPFSRERLSDAEIKANPKGGKYRSPKGEGCRLFHSPLAIAGGKYEERLMDRFTPLRITEGEMKTIAANVHDPGRVTIGLGGVSSWRDRYDGQGKDIPSRPIIELVEIPMNGREVRICFDSDLEKPQVAAALHQLAAWLVEEKEAYVLIEILPHGLDGRRLGIDDLIHTYGPDVFLSIASIAKPPFDPQPSDTRERNVYLSGMLGCDWKSSRDGKDHWLRWTGTHWENVQGDDDILYEVERFMALQGWKNRELSTVRSLVAAFRRTIGPAPEILAQGLLPFRNGCLIPEEMRLVPHAREHGNTWSLPYDYDVNADCPGIKSFLLDRLGDHDSVAVFRAFARGLLLEVQMKCFLEFSGPGNTGKTVIAHLLMALVGSSNTSAMKLQRLEDPSQRFETLRLRGKRLAVFSEAGDYSGRVEVLKAMTGDDPITAEIKGGRHLEFIYRGGVVLVGNAPIRPSDPSGAVLNRRRSFLISKVIPSSEERMMLASDGNGGWSGELVPELPGFVNWALAMPATEAKQALARDVKSLARAEQELVALLTTDSLAQWAEEMIMWTDEHGAFLRVGKADSDAGQFLFPSYVRYIQQLGKNTNPLSLNVFKGKLVDLLRDTLTLPLPPGNPKSGPYDVRGVGSVIPHLAWRCGDEENLGVIRHGFMARVEGTTSERPGNDQTPEGNDRNDRNDLEPLPHMEEKNAGDSSSIGESGSKAVTDVTSVPHKGFSCSQVVTEGAKAIPPKPWHDPALRIHREDPRKAYNTIALDLQRLGHPNILGRQVRELLEDAS
jgi:phage/plasmid-associated DNA primase